MDQLEVHPDRPVLELERVTKAYRPDKAILRGLSFQVHRGEFVFVTGASGAGKSTLLRLIYRAEEPDEGHLYFCGREIGRLREASIPRFRRSLGIVFQDFKNLVDRTVFENVAIALEVTGMPTRAIRLRVAETLRAVGLEGRGAEVVCGLSGGEQQRVAIARAIVTKPLLLLTDEPTGNLDPALAMDMVGLFEELHAQGTTVLFATHDRSLLTARRHRVLALEDGRIREVRPMYVARDEETLPSGPLSVAHMPVVPVGSRLPH